MAMHSFLDTLPFIFCPPLPGPQLQLVAALFHANRGNGLQIDCNWQRLHAEQLNALLQPSKAATVDWLEGVQEHIQSITGVYCAQDFSLLITLVCT